MSTITEQISGILNDLEYDGATPSTVTDALNALADVLSGDDAPDAKTIAEAIGNVNGEFSPVASGNVSITENGTEVDVAQYATASVAVPAYVISFDANGGTGTVAPMACAKGSTATLPDGTGLTPPSQKVFSGWGTTSDATEIIETYAATAATTLYAIYADA